MQILSRRMPGSKMQKLGMRIVLGLKEKRVRENTWKSRRPHPGAQGLKEEAGVSETSSHPSHKSVQSGLIESYLS